MELALNQRMRELRARKKNTQEQLAVHLGVTTQAVSKWERGEGFPDITLLPAIAAFYNVSVDNLLGVDEAARKKKLNDYVERDKKLSRAQDVSERISLWTEAYREFPNEPQVLHGLSFALRSEGIEQHSEKIIPLARRLLKEARRSGEYFGAINNLSRAYASMGNIEEAKRYASMAGRYVGTENQLMIHILQGEEAAAFCQWNIETLVDLISTNAHVMLQKGTFTLDERIHIAHLMIQLFALVYEDGCYGFYHSRVSRWYMRLAKCYAQKQDQNQTLLCLESAADHAMAFDMLKDGRYTALLVNRQEFHSGSNSEKQVAARQKEMADACFDFVRTDTRFEEILDKTRSA